MTSKKPPSRIYLFVAFLWFFCPLLYAADYPPVDVEMPVHQVSPNSYYVSGPPGIATDNAGFISNAGFVVTPEGVVVFDALGSPSLAWKLRESIREITPLPVVKVVVSHYHADHIYGLQVFKEEGALIVAPAAALDYLESDAAAERLEERRFTLDPWVNDATYLVPPDKLVDADRSFEVGGVNFRILFMGKAHSDGDLAMLVEPDQVLFSGDLIFEGRIPFVGDADTRGWLANLESMNTRGLAALVPGHGPAAKNPAAAIRLTRDYLKHLRAVMGAAVDDLVEFDDAYATADWSAFSKVPAFEAANRLNAYAVYLSMEREMMQ